VIEHSAFEADPWLLRETTLNLDHLAQSESVFALSNGHIGWRGNLEEGEPHGLPGCYLNGVFESRELPYAEAGYGYPESGQTVINVPNGKLIRVLVDDEPLDIRYGELNKHERVLDMRAGTLSRAAEWMAPTGRTVRVRSTRMVSFTQRAVAAIHYEIEPVDGPTRIVLQSELVANESMSEASKDPRMGAVLTSPLVGRLHAADTTRVVMVHETRSSGLRVAAAMDHVLECPSHYETRAESYDDLGRYIVAAVLEPGQTLRLIKFVAYGWSGQRSEPGLRAQVDAAVAAARHTGWDQMLVEQREYLDGFWARADVELDGDDRIQQAVRFGLFHVAQAGARAERRAIPAKGLTGPGYDGHSFWDSEIFALPVLTYTIPDAAAHALKWRYDILPTAQARAKELGYEGAAFPWRTISGPECSAYWPAGTAAFHINADIADAVMRYADATADDAFLRREGLALLVNTARLLRSFGHFDGDGRFRIDGVTGPDEYSAIADNNVYTNLMARKNLVCAAEVALKFADEARELDVTHEEIGEWERAAEAMVVVYDERLGVHPQSEGFTDHQLWDFEKCTDQHYPLMLSFPYLDLYRKQVTKQADLVLAIYLCPDEFTTEQKVRDFGYYEELTVRDSSLSACVQAVVAAEVGHLELAKDYLGEAAFMDLDDLEHNTRDGVHIASLAGAWLALVAGFGGLRHRIGKPLHFAPKLPPGITRLAFRLFFRGRLLEVETTGGQARYTLLEGEPMEILHYDELLKVDRDAPAKRPIPQAPQHPRPHQPHGRAPKKIS
jgi:alpha,alpha-trehalose phosphorylase